MAERNILVECYADTLLIRQLSFEPFAFHSGVGEVANHLQKYFSKQKALAIIDNDKNCPSYFSHDCRVIKEENDVILLKHKVADHYVIKISPAFEEFTNSAALECEIKLFERDLKKFKLITKDSKLHSNYKFVNYLNHLVAKNPAGIRTLKKFISYAQSEKQVSVGNSTKDKTGKKRS